MPTPLPLRPLHRRWLAAEAERLLGFHRASLGGPAGFRMLGLDGQPLHGPDEVFHLHDTARFVHVLSMATQLGIPGLRDGIDQGMRFLWQRHRDATRGGYLWGVRAEGPAPIAEKRAYGHAFVLLAGASALRVGHPDARRLLDDVTEVLEARFWEDGPGAAREAFTEDWEEIEPDYRGQNANMHLAEALMAAFEATGERVYLDRALRIADLIVNRAARAHGWRVAEHFRADWMVDLGHEGDPMFRPAGVTPGHGLEWARLLVQLFDLSGKAHGWMIEAARGLFATATAHGWDGRRGGFLYTLGWDDRPLNPLRLWWPNAEAIGAAATLWRFDGDAGALGWYERVWDVVARQFIDTARGGWFAENGDDGRPREGIFHGKPDIYHAFQACIVALLPAGTHLSGDLSAVAP
ncbi:MAG: AGE family epimerase/isomerase [Alphaproteobacteria bacterium]|nr:MAG: AGE family epimerase/isomerase [Alphaproteobacteria bacterium]